MFGGARPNGRGRINWVSMRTPKKEVKEDVVEISTEAKKDKLVGESL